MHNSCQHARFEWAFWSLSEILSWAHRSCVGSSAWRIVDASPIGAEFGVRSRDSWPRYAFVVLGRSTVPREGSDTVPDAIRAPIRGGNSVRNVADRGSVLADFDVRLPTVHQMRTRATTTAKI